MGVFTWWAAGSEKDGLDALESLFKNFPNNTFVNLAVAGGAGSNAKAKLASDLQNNQPPDSFQGHAGAELLDYIDAEQIEPVNDVITALGGDKVFPKNLLDRITVEGSIYSVPSNIHRTSCGPTRRCSRRPASTPSRRTSPAGWPTWTRSRPPASSTPLSVSGTWTQVHLFETVLMADLGVGEYNGLRRRDRVGLDRGQAGSGRLQEAADLRQHGVRR